MSGFFVFALTEIEKIKILKLAPTYSPFKESTIGDGGLNSCRQAGLCSEELNLNSLCWRLPTLPSKKVPSAMEGLTSVFGMRTGVPPPLKHQHKEFKFNAFKMRTGGSYRTCTPFGYLFRLSPIKLSQKVLRRATGTTHPLSSKHQLQNFNIIFSIFTIIKTFGSYNVLHIFLTDHNLLKIVSAMYSIPCRKYVLLVLHGSTHYYAYT